MENGFQFNTNEKFLVKADDKVVKIYFSKSLEDVIQDIRELGFNHTASRTAVKIIMKGIEDAGEKAKLLNSLTDEINKGSVEIIFKSGKEGSLILYVDIQNKLFADDNFSAYEIEVFLQRLFQIGELTFCAQDANGIIMTVDEDVLNSEDVQADDADNLNSPHCKSGNLVLDIEVQNKVLKTEETVKAHIGGFVEKLMKKTNGSKLFQNPITTAVMELGEPVKEDDSNVAQSNPPSNRNTDEGFESGTDATLSDDLELDKVKQFIRKNRIMNVVSFEGEVKSPTTDKSSETKEDELICFLQKIGLEHYYPCKLNLLDAITVRREEKVCSLVDVPWIFIGNIVANNCNARDHLIEQHLEKVWESQTFSIRDWSFDEIGEKQKNVSQVDWSFDEVERTNLSQGIHPLDLLVSVFKCSSPNLKQFLASKLSMCRQAIPFSLPTRTSEIPVLSLLAIQPIVIEQRLRTGTIASTALNCLCDVVTFIRLGNVTLSKSQLINQILSQYQYHDIFFNKDCPLGTSKRVISNGMIECAWHVNVADAKSTQMYLNLRGDGRYCEQQLQLLSRISSVLVIMLGIEHLEDIRSKKILQELHQCLPGIVLAVDNSVKTDSEAYLICQKYLLEIQEYRSRTAILKLSINGNKRSIFHIKKETIKQIYNLIQDKTPLMLSKTLQKVIGVYCTSDEGSTKFRKAKRKAESIMKLITNDFVKIKHNILPLQGEFINLSCEQHITSKQLSEYNVVEESDRKKEEMKNLCMKQLRIFSDQSLLLKTFLTDILNKNETNEDCDLFLSYFKVLVDDRSRRILPDYIRKYQLARNTLKETGIGKETNQQTAKERFIAAEYNLSAATFGIEDLLRECAQLYEAITCCGEDATKEQQLIANDLTKMAAKILLLGHPLELIDGSLLTIPIRWINGVMGKVKNTIGDKKILTVTIIGVQSSGKSTLLNTMFGLQFPVSQGYCTRGASLQLIPVKKGDYKFDYILVIDSQGLRASDLGREKLHNDIKLATFIIGVGDISIINIKGEVIADMSDILQIVVRAFLRLKLHNSRLNLKRRCLFVHQNVSAITAKEKNIQERKYMVGKLDKMTQEAALQERVTDINYFDQLIDFDVEKDVWYFPDLWFGDPPATYVNPGYSKCVSEIRQYFLSNISSLRNTFLNITDTMLLIEDLFDGIFVDNSLLQFRTTLFDKAYEVMEKGYQTLSWSMYKFFYEFLLNRVKPLIEECANENEIKLKSDDITTQLLKQTEVKYCYITTELNKLVDQSDLKDILMHWMQSNISRLAIFKKSLLDQTKKEINGLIDEKRKRLQMDLNTEFKSVRKEQIRDLVDSVKGKEVSRVNLKDEFECFWLKCLRNNYVCPEVSSDDSVVKSKIETLVWEEFPELAKNLWYEFDEKQSEYVVPLVGSMTPDDFEIDQHFVIHHSLFLNASNLEDIKKDVLETTNEIFRKIDKKINEICSRDTSFNLEFVTDMFTIIITCIDDHNKLTPNDLKFSLLTGYKALLIKHVVNYITKVFTRLEYTFIQKHSLRNQLQEYKGTAWDLFQDEFEDNTEEIRVVSMLYEILNRIVIDYVSLLVLIDIQDIMLAKFSYKKSVILRKVLISLADKDDFREYCRYIKEPNAYVQEWLTNYVQSTFFDKKVYSISTYANIAHIRIRSIFIEIKKCEINATQMCLSEVNASISHWIEFFTKQLKHSNVLPISVQYFRHFTQRTVSDISVFGQLVIARLGISEKFVNDHFSKQNRENITWGPYNLLNIIDRLLGCTETCPTCFEPCKHINMNHLAFDISHQCLQHKVKGTVGAYKEKSGKLSLNACTVDVAVSSLVFLNTESMENSGLKNTLTIDTWDMNQSLDSSKYWIWILCRFKKNFEEKYKRKFSHIPLGWKHISKLEAYQSLK